MSPLELHPSYTYPEVFVVTGSGPLSVWGAGESLVGVSRRPRRLNLGSERGRKRSWVPNTCVSQRPTLWIFN